MQRCSTSSGAKTVQHFKRCKNDAALQAVQKRCRVEFFNTGCVRGAKCKRCKIQEVQNAGGAKRCRVEFFNTGGARGSSIFFLGGALIFFGRCSIFFGGCFDFFFLKFSDFFEIINFDKKFY